MKDKLKIRNIHKVFKTKKDEIVAIDNISLDVKQGEIVGIVGTSGCGKSTLLNIIANLEDATSGELVWDKDNPKISYMLQSDALLPWRSVLDNATIGLELMHEKSDENVTKVINLLKEYGLGDFLNKKTNALSGGMKQRVERILHAHRMTNMDKSLLY